ncbi:gamma-glutamylcyclotransferase [Noviherbaspirillum denitrificans]|uniref:glutathione-specific gamma-glutamylcyclotransferase n=1 Tax=Noviherbaspirillum denitrificans TaxID=1968433 RepID=A0A254TKE3_9BURK|nr:gamma-glutamylcyclotransferase [Noviherbaspirillum denitrificans]OWW20178.1 cation transporter [Noviherbaspirillum denitrificans]
MKTIRRMDLTQEMVTLVHRQVEDGGPLPGLDHQTDDDYHAMTSRLLSSHADGEDAWLFAYGSLIWKPECEHVEERCGTAQGWHRSFCFRVWRFRGTRECPGLMMALDRGGQCKGVLLRLPAASLREQVDRLCRREITVKPANTSPRWVTVVSDGIRLRAIAFVMNRTARAYVGKLSPEETAEVLVKACGHWGSGAEYLFNTVCKLEERGIHDRYLWQLQRLVAERIKPALPNPPATSIPLNGTLQPQQ